MRSPPSSCLSDWVAPCMRRFSSLMSNVALAMALSPELSFGSPQCARV